MKNHHLWAIGIIGVASYLYFSARAIFTPLYEGPVSVPGVEQVKVMRNYESAGAGLHRYAYRMGQSIEIILADGSIASIYDTNSNFRLDPSEKTTGNVPENLSDILNATKQEL